MDPIAIFLPSFSLFIASWAYVVVIVVLTAGSSVLLTLAFVYFFLLREVKITYVLAGGENDPMNPEKVSRNSLEVLLGEPTREGYFFKGWFLDKGFTKPVKAISSHPRKSLALYAKWEKEG